MEENQFVSNFSMLFPDRQAASVRSFFSPGRINLIGEHTDYNGGYVFPAAITYGTYGTAGKRQDRNVRVYSHNFPEAGMIEFSLDNLIYDPADQWANYAKGMFKYIEEAGFKLDCGLDIEVYGNIPNGAGLSSSASLEMLIGVIADEMFGLGIDRIRLVQLGQQVENEFIGVNSGIMDQFAIGMGKENAAVLLDCSTLDYQYAPCDLGDREIVIMNTNKRRELADSKYNERRGECETALKIIQQKADIKALGQLTEEQFEQYKPLLADEVLIKRARHAVYENARTKKAFSSLEEGDLFTFGKYMNESHISLRDDYEVTGPELDALVEAAWKQEGALGARMTGAGFGGCAIALVESSSVESFIKEVGREYKDKIGYEAEFYTARIGDGTKEIKEDAK